MSSKTVTRQTTAADKYMLAYPSSTVSHSKWDVSKAKALEAKQEYYVTISTVSATGKPATGTSPHAKLPVKVDGILNERVRQVRNKRTGIKGPSTIKQKVFLPYIPVAYLTAAAKKANLSATEAEKLGKRLNLAAVDLGIKYKGVATKHLPVRIGGHIDKVSVSLREFGLDFAFKTDPDNQEPVANKYNLEIIDEFSFHGTMRFGDKNFIANVSEDPSWVENHIYGKVWKTEHAQAAEEKLFIRIEGADGTEVTIDTFHYITKYLFRTAKKEDFDNNFLYSNEASPKKYTPAQARATVDTKKTTIADTLASQLAGESPIHLKEQPNPLGGGKVPTESIYFTLDKNNKFSLDKRSWKVPDEAAKVGYLLPTFKFSAGKLNKELEVNEGNNTDVYISLYRTKKDEIIDEEGKKKVRTLRDTSYDPLETLKHFKMVFKPLIEDSDKFFKKVDTQLPIALAKANANASKKKEEAIRRFRVGLVTSEEGTENQTLAAAEVGEKSLPAEGEDETIQL